MMQVSLPPPVGAQPDEALARYLVDIEAMREEDASSTSYSSDSEETTSGASVSSMTSVSSAPCFALTSDVLFESDEDDEQSDSEDEMSFLLQKQRILKRAVSAMKSEAAYDATQARTVLLQNKDNAVKRSPLFEQATEVLALLEPRNKKKRSLLPHPIPPRRRSTTNHKRLKIDTRSVSCIQAKAYEATPIHSVVSSKPLSLSSAWVTNVLNRRMASSTSSPSTTTTTTSTEWRSVNDPHAGVLAIPPTTIPTPNSMLHLEDALAFTEHARLVTLSCPPFGVVHANKAFCAYSGMSHAKIIGMPIESILNVKVGGSDASDVQNVGQLMDCCQGKNKGPSQVTLAPIVANTKEQAGFSHFMITMESLHDDDVHETLFENTEALATTPANDLVTKNKQNPHHHQLIGTVG